MKKETFKRNVAAIKDLRLELKNGGELTVNEFKAVQKKLKVKEANLTRRVKEIAVEAWKKEEDGFMGRVLGGYPNNGLDLVDAKMNKALTQIELKYEVQADAGHANTPWKMNYKVNDLLD